MTEQTTEKVVQVSCLHHPDFPVLPILEYTQNKFQACPECRRGGQDASYFLDKSTLAIEGERLQQEKLKKFDIMLNAKEGTQPPNGYTKQDNAIVSEFLSRQFFNGRTFQPNKLAEQLESLRKFKTVNNEVYAYSEALGHYRPAKRAICLYTNRSLGDRSNPSFQESVVQEIKTHTHFQPKPEESHFVALQNGIYDTINLTLLPFTPDIFITGQLPFAYDPQAQCPKFLKYLNEALPNKPAQIKTIKQIFAYTLYRGAPLQRAFMLYGSQGCGKSQVLSLLQKFVGDENTSNVSLQALEKEKHARATLFGKMLNICADLPRSSLSEAPNFKLLTTGEAVTAEQKYKDPFSLLNTAKLVFSANKMPKILDEDLDAWAARWVFIKFGETFRGTAKEKSEIWRDIASDELPGIFNEVLPYLKPLIERTEGFAGDSTIEEKKVLYMVESDPIAAFIKDCCIDPVTLDEPSEALFVYQAYESYLGWCRENKRDPVESGVFSRDFGRNAKYLFADFKTCHPLDMSTQVPKQRAGYLGVSLNAVGINCRKNHHKKQTEKEFPQTTLDKPN